jgi:hypothetical protein
MPGLFEIPVVCPKCGTVHDRAVQTSPPVPLEKLLVLCVSCFLQAIPGPLRRRSR